MGKNIKKIIAISIISSSLFFSGCIKSPKEEKVYVPALSESNKMEYETCKVEKGDIFQEDKSFGNVKSLDRHILFSGVTGARVKGQYFKKGNYVKKGELIAELYSLDLDNEIEIQKLSVEDAKIYYEKLKNENVNEYDKRLAEVSLEYERKKLARLVDKRDSLTVYSPIDGVISEMEEYKIGSELGESNIIAIVDGSDEIVIHSTRTKQTWDIYFEGMVAVISYKGNNYIGEVIKVDKGDIKGVTKKQGAFIKFVDEVPEGLYIGKQLRFRVIGEKKENVLMIPIESLYEAYDYKYVYVLNNGLKVKKNVDVGIVTKEYAEIISGLEENEEVIIKEHSD